MCFNKRRKPPLAAQGVGAPSQQLFPQGREHFHVKVFAAGHGRRGEEPCCRFFRQRNARYHVRIAGRRRVGIGRVAEFPYAGGGHVAPEGDDGIDRDITLCAKLEP